MDHSFPRVTIMRVIFMGSPDFAVPTLYALIAAKHEVTAAYCQPPRAAGRGKAVQPTPAPGTPPTDASGQLVPTIPTGMSEPTAPAALPAPATGQAPTTQPSASAMPSTANGVSTP